MTGVIAETVERRRRRRRSASASNTPGVNCRDNVLVVVVLGTSLRRPSERTIYERGVMRVEVEQQVISVAGCS